MHEVGRHFESNQEGSSTLQCRVCSSDRVTTKWVTNKTREYYGHNLEFNTCLSCDFISSPLNIHYHLSEDDFDPSARIGDGTHFGREYYMLQCALEIIKGSKLDVLFFGSGLSRDFMSAASNDRIVSSHTTDMKNFLQSDAFIPIDSDRLFDIIICSEVIEHFEYPNEAFKTLFKFAKPSGVIICSTDINDLQSELCNTIYPFFSGHVSYYSGHSLLHLAKANGFQCDFRLPDFGLKNTPSKKRYIYFFKDPKIQEEISLYFSRIPFALAED